LTPISVLRIAHGGISLDDQNAGGARTFLLVKYIGQAKTKLNQKNAPSKAWGKMGGTPSMMVRKLFSVH
jgi:hypothetical protein